jgi:hypothetical protein
MNIKQFLSVLLVITFLVVGCKPENFTGSAASSTPAPQQTLRLSEPIKLSLAASSLTLQDVWNFRVAGLLATAEISGEIRPILIDPENGQVQGLQSPLRLASTGTSAVRYIPRRTSYAKDNHSFGELFVFDLQQGSEFQIANNQPDLASVSGSTVVWEGYGEDGWNIYAYDIAAQQMVTVTHGTEGRSYPYISGSWIIYLDMGQVKTLHAYNLSTQEALTLGTVPHPTGREGKYHLISNDKVVWANAETYDLHVLDLDTRATEVITDPVTTCQPLYQLGSMVRHTLLYLGCEGWALYDLDSKASVNIPVLPPEIREMMAQNKNNEDAMYGVNWIGMSDTRLAWTVIDSLGHSWLYTSRVER